MLMPLLMLVLMLMLCLLFNLTQLEGFHAAEAAYAISQQLQLNQLLHLLVTPNLEGVVHD